MAELTYHDYVAHERARRRLARSSSTRRAPRSGARASRLCGSPCTARHLAQLATQQEHFSSRAECACGTAACAKYLVVHGVPQKITARGNILLGAPRHA